MHDAAVKDAEQLEEVREGGSKDEKLLTPLPGIACPPLLNSHSKPSRVCWMARQASVTSTVD
jgi:hypothetical protein